MTALWFVKIVGEKLQLCFVSIVESMLFGIIDSESKDIENLIDEVFIPDGSGD